MPHRDSTYRDHVLRHRHDPHRSRQSVAVSALRHLDNQGNEVEYEHGTGKTFGKAGEPGQQTAFRPPQSYVGENVNLISDW